MTFEKLMQKDTLLQNLPNNNNNKIPKVVAIIPAYNESISIESIIKETLKHVDTVIVIDDGSSDNTAEIASKLKTRVIGNATNMGKGAALKKGLLECIAIDADIIVTLDADGQHNPADIPNLVKPIENGVADIVIGSRYISGNSNEIPKLRGNGLSFINCIYRFFMKTTVKDSQSGYRAYRKTVLNALSKYKSTGYGVETEQLVIAEKNHYNIVEVPVKIRYKGLTNTSKKNPILHGMDIISIIFKMTIENNIIKTHLSSWKIVNKIIKSSIIWNIK